MARDRANINTAVWTDDDWRDLGRDEQWLYIALLTSPTLSYAGVADWRPGRIAVNAEGTTAADVERIGQALQARRFIFIDADTEEVLIRSFLRHDGLLKQPKLAVSMVNAHGAIASKKIRRVVVHELHRLHAEHPYWRAFEVEKVQALLKLEGADMSTFTPTVTPGLTPTVTPDVTPGLTPTLTQSQALPTTTATTTATPADAGGSGGNAPRPPASANRKKPATPLPGTWAPTDSHKTKAAERGIDVDAEAEAFRLHAEAHDRRAVRWDAAFSMWLTKATPTSQTRNGADSVAALAAWNNYQPDYDDDPAPAYHEETLPL